VKNIFDAGGNPKKGRARFGARIAGRQRLRLAAQTIEAPLFRHEGEYGRLAFCKPGFEVREVIGKW
jgi:hypothetical protein